MKEFVEKLLNELNYQKEHYQKVHDVKPRTKHEKDLNAVLQNTYDSSIRIVNQLAEEYNNDFCQWKYNGIMYDICPHTETRFARIHNCDENIFKFCPYCGKKIKIAPYQPEEGRE